MGARAERCSNFAVRPPLLCHRFEVELVVLAATGIERRFTVGAFTAAIEILADGQLFSAGAAQHGRLVPLTAGPNLNRMARERFMTVFASIVKATTSHFDCDDVQGGVVMGAARLAIQIDSADD